MKVLLKEDVDNLGYAGEVYQVADGYGRNFLIPQGLAVLASPSVMKQADFWRKKAEARREELREEYKLLSEKIENATLNYEARAGETGKLYGSVTTSQITDDLNELLGTEIDRRKVGVEPLRQLGEHEVIVRLSADFQPNLTVIIEPEEGSPAAMMAEVETIEEVVEEVVEEAVEEAEAEFETLIAVSETEEILESLADELAEEEASDEIKTDDLY